MLTKQLSRPRGRRLLVDLTSRGRSVWSRYGARAPQKLHRPSTRALVTTAAGSAAAAGVYALVRYAVNHRRPEEEDYDPAAVSDYRLLRLCDLRRDRKSLVAIQQALLAEWGPFAPKDFKAMRDMARSAGKLSFILDRGHHRRFQPVAILQTVRVDAGGDPMRLIERFPLFSALTSHGTWKRVSRRGDTAVLLQITALGERSRGSGSLLRDAALHALPEDVKYALTTTPVDDFDLDGPVETYPPQVKFHYRGGARPAGYRAGFKIAPAGVTGGRQHHPNVVFMRYRRLEDGTWEGVRQPDLTMSRTTLGSRVASLLRRGPRRPSVVLPPDLPASAPTP